MGSLGLKAPGHCPAGWAPGMAGPAQGWGGVWLALSAAETAPPPARSAEEKPEEPQPGITQHLRNNAEVGCPALTEHLGAESTRHRPCLCDNKESRGPGRSANVFLSDATSVHLSGLCL